MEGGVKQPCPAPSTEIRLCSGGVNPRVRQPRRSGGCGIIPQASGSSRSPRPPRRGGAARSRPLFMGFLKLGSDGTSSPDFLLAGDSPRQRLGPWRGPDFLSWVWIPASSRISPGTGAKTNPKLRCHQPLVSPASSVSSLQCHFLPPSSPSPIFLRNQGTCLVQVSPHRPPAPNIWGQADAGLAPLSMPKKQWHIAVHLGKPRHTGHTCKATEGVLRGCARLQERDQGCAAGNVSGWT